MSLYFSIAAHSEHAHESEWSNSTTAPRSQYAVRRAARTTHAEPDERTDARYSQTSALTHRQTQSIENSGNFSKPVFISLTNYFRHHFCQLHFLTDDN